MRRPLHCLAAAVCFTAVQFAAAQPAEPGGAMAYQPPADAPAHLLSAWKSAERTDAMRARDAGRKPVDVMMLAGIEAGDHIVEIAGFGHYYTTMLSAAVGPGGRIDIYDMPYTERFAGEASRAFDAAHDNVFYHQQDYNAVEFPSGVDVVMNVLYYHDLQPLGIDTAAMNRKLFDALQPGGTMLIIDHKAEDGSGWRDAGTIHRMGVETIPEEVTAAGFELVVDSDLLAHPEDDRTQNVFQMRGETDRALFVFRKPGG